VDQLHFGIWNILLELKPNPVLFRATASRQKQTSVNKRIHIKLWSCFARATRRSTSQGGSGANENFAEMADERYLVFGPRGWIGGKLIEMLKAEGKHVQGASSRLENRESVLQELDDYKPTHVFNCAGCTGRPNVDWCEDNKEATVRSNVIGTLNLVDCCNLRGIHVTNYATGCIYQYDDAHPARSGKGFTETSEPNFDGSFYSKTKALTEKVLASYSNVLTLRLRMPVSDDLHPRNFVTKISKYEYVVDIPNSNSILYDLLPLSMKMAATGLTGVYNFTNPGAISHNEVLSLFKQYVRPDFTWKNFSLEEQAKVIKAGRSNCELDSSKLEACAKSLGHELPEIHEAYKRCFIRMAKNLANQ
jgi:3,5-epimerase/4-reductase